MAPAHQAAPPNTLTPAAAPPERPPIVAPPAMYRNISQPVAPFELPIIAPEVPPITAPTIAGISQGNSPDGSVYFSGLFRQ